MRQASVSGNAFDLTGQVALITGASVGLGQAIAVALADAGADIAGVSRRTPTETATLVKATGRRFIGIEADLSSTKPIAAIVEHTKRDLGGLDILVNNAGIIRRADSIEFSEEDWDAVIDTNLKSAFFLCQAAGRHMIAQGRGKVINVASMLSFQGGIRVASYTASKSGIAGLTRLLANEWAAKGVNVNAIAPGYMVTDNTTQLREDPKRSAEILSRIPAGRWGEPSDLGGAAVFLASRASDYVNGAIIPVDGGWLAR
jgi:2-deoxy-D-gluconate 3-dehydrogenase